MEGGCFRMIAIALHNDVLCNKVSIVGEDLTRDVFIPKKHIVSVVKFETPFEHFQAGWKTFVCMDQYEGCAEFRYSLDMFFGPLMEYIRADECICGARKLVDKKYQCEETLPKPINTMALCTCKLNIFPLYEVTVENRTEISQYPDGSFGATPLVTYLLHPDERPRMERYLEGETLHELFNLLRYGPPTALIPKGGTEYQEAQERTGPQLKKLKEFHE